MNTKINTNVNTSVIKDEEQTALLKELGINKKEWNRIDSTLQQRITKLYKNRK